MKLVTKEDFSPGTVVVVSNGIFDGIAVVFDKIVWAELAQTDICKEQIEKVLKDGNLIPLRTLGGIKGPTGKPVEYVDRNIEPNASVIRNYIYSNVGGDIWIVEDPTSLREAYFFFQRVYRIRDLDDAMLDLSMVCKYLIGDYKGDYVVSDNQHGKKMLALLKRGIPL